VNVTFNPTGTPQGTSGTSVTGPVVQGIVSDNPPAVANKNTAQPLSLTGESRLRVIAEDPEMNFTPAEHPWGDSLNYSGSVW
jgi:hypothetical protein